MFEGQHLEAGLHIGAPACDVLADIFGSGFGFVLVNPGAGFEGEGVTEAGFDGDVFGDVKVTVDFG